MLAKVLNVAEKNDVAKGIADILSRGRYNRRPSFSKFNQLYEFDLHMNILNAQQLKMTVTSVSGHLFNYEFAGAGSRNWQTTPIGSLFEMPVKKICNSNSENIKRTLENEAKKVDHLVIWTDCDREGENIGSEICQICRGANRNLNIHRARFSEITSQAINHAIRNLTIPNERTSQAVDCRQELDLRVGAAFTRYQTLLAQKEFPTKLQNLLISYGSCQFPTLGFVVERYKENENFIKEPFWKICVEHKKIWNRQRMEDANNRFATEILVEFHWCRVRLFDKQACQTLLAICQENPTAKVESVVKRPKNKWRPLPLETVSLEKLASKKLKLNARRTMEIAQNLYTRGYISYPRTETDKFPDTLNLANLVQLQVPDHRWGQFAQKILNDGCRPRHGTKNDEAHPPIHPIKHARPMELKDDEQKVYEFITRHFLACLSDDAKGFETNVHIDINGEKFSASGLIIAERNFLDVYPYESWSDKELPDYEEGEQFRPDSIRMADGKTAPPNLLTEADLISLMEKHGIGTDATHAEHIEKIKDRRYVALNQQNRFVPGFLGLGLVEGYDSMGYQMSKPNLRAELERGLVDICEGRRSKDDVLREHISRYKTTFQQAFRQSRRLVDALSKYFGDRQRGTGDDLGISDGNNDEDHGPSPPPPPRPSHPDNGHGFDNDNRKNYDDHDQGGGVAINVPQHGPRNDPRFPTPFAPNADPYASRLSNSNVDVDQRLLCHCGDRPVERTVKKEGPNVGRKFYACSKRPEARCNFFAWSNNAPDVTSGRVSDQTNFDQNVMPYGNLGNNNNNNSNFGWRKNSNSKSKSGANVLKSTSEFFPVSVKWQSGENSGSGSVRHANVNVGHDSAKRRRSFDTHGHNEDGAPLRHLSGGYVVKQLNAKGGVTSNARRCSNCRETGHFANKCPRKL